MSLTNVHGNVFVQANALPTSQSFTSSVANVTNFVQLRGFVVLTGGMSGTLIHEGTVRVPSELLPDSPQIGRWPIGNWSTIDTLVVSQSNGTVSQSLFAQHTQVPWAYTRYRWTPATPTTGVTGSITTFTSAKR